MSNYHPEYPLALLDWIVMRDTYAGERAIKNKTQIYLPATSGQTEDGLGTNQPGAKSYEAR